MTLASFTWTSWTDILASLWRRVRGRQDCGDLCHRNTRSICLMSSQPPRPDQTGVGRGGRRWWERQARRREDEGAVNVVREEEEQEDDIKISQEMMAAMSVQARPHTQVDYIHHLVPYLQEITSCSFYWGKMDRYEAEELLEKQQEGSFLLRDSAQDEFLFSVSFRRYGRSLHARIEEQQHKFSFDCHDPGVFSARNIPQLLEHYKDPASCMFFEPMLCHPVNRKNPFSLQVLARASICDSIESYSDVDKLELPKSLKVLLKEYHYRHQVRVRTFA